MGSPMPSMFVVGVPITKYGGGVSGIGSPSATGAIWLARSDRTRIMEAAKLSGVISTLKGNNIVNDLHTSQFGYPTNKGLVIVLCHVSVLLLFS